MTDSPQHVTLVANTVTPVVFATNYARVEVLNRSGDAEVYITTDGTAPTVGGEGCQVLPAAISSIELPRVGDSAASGGLTVNLISSGTPKVSVRGL